MIALGVAVTVAIVVAVVRMVLHHTASPAPAAPPVATSAPRPATSTSVVTASAVSAPPGFPDLDGFTDVSADHDVSGLYPLAKFSTETGLQCAMWSSRGDTAAFCFGAIPGLDHPANQVYAGDYQAHFSQGAPPAADLLGGKPLASGEKIVLGAGGTLMGGDQITCGAHGVVVACTLIRGFGQNHGDASAQQHGFVLDPQRSWTF
jgi:hypothetical protein